MKTTKNNLVLALSAIAFAACAVHQPASAEEPETAPVTFGILIRSNELSDADGDGVPEIPDLSVGSFAGVVFGRAFEANSILSFAADSPDCGDFEVGGTDWLNNSPTMLVGKGAPIVGTSYGGFGPLFPPERRFLQARDVTVAHACWVKENGSGELFVQAGYDANRSVVAFVVVTAEFRLQDLL